MPKHKIEAQVELQDQPMAKRRRVPHLNFSIESMMQPASQQAASPSGQAKHQVGSRSPSPAGLSEAGSASSTSTGTPTSNNQNHQPNDNESLSSSRSSSRASTPISPGCNSSSLETAAMAPSEHPNPFLHQPARVQQNSGQVNGGPIGHLPHHHQAGPTSNHQNSSAGTSATTGGGSGSSAGKASKRGSHSSNSRIRPVCTDSRLAPFECHLDNLDLWHRFHPLDTEMIITKQGRRMFPPVRVTFSFNDQLLHQQQQQQQPASNQLQFNSRDKYQVLMDILPYDNKRYRYAYHKSSWQQAGKADPPSPTKLFLHPDGPFTLDQLKRQVISFEKIKLTNNDANKHGYIVLNSMHKYQPRIHLILWRGKESQNLVNAPVNLLDMEAHKTFVFSETIFTAVTAYQNHSITKLKIDSNPFAKGFRDSTRLTDLELESMQDLISDGQCPFSPPRAPPPGFPHFLFAAAQHPQFAAAYGHQGAGQFLPPSSQALGGHPSGLGQQQGLPPGGPQGKHEDAAAALLRERTIMALDSFFQQQQQQTSNGDPNGGQAKQAGGPNQQQILQRTSSASASTPEQHAHQSSPATSAPSQQVCQFGPAFADQLPSSQSNFGPPPPPPVGLGQRPGGFPSHEGLEQFILAQQQQFAAAMAAAAAASGLHPQHHAGQPPPPPYQAHDPLQSLFAQAAAAQQHLSQSQNQSLNLASQQNQLGSPTGTKLGNSPPPPTTTNVRHMTAAPAITTSAHLSHSQPHQQANQQGHLQDQTSPIGAAKSAARMLDLNNFLAAPLGGAASGVHQSQGTISAGAGAGGAHQIHPQHLQALIQHHQQQMAALAHQQHHNQLDSAPQLQLMSAEGGVASKPGGVAPRPKAAATTGAPASAKSK